MAGNNMTASLLRGNRLREPIQKFATEEVQIKVAEKNILGGIDVISGFVYGHLVFRSSPYGVLSSNWRPLRRNSSLAYAWSSFNANPTKLGPVLVSICAIKEGRRHRRDLSVCARKSYKLYFHCWAGWASIAVHAFEEPTNNIV